MDISIEEMRQEKLDILQGSPTEENLWMAVIAYQGYPFHTASGLPFQYQLKVGKNGQWNRELLIDRRENSKSLAWSSVVLAFQHARQISEEIPGPKKLGNIRGISYIYAIFWKLELIKVPDTIAEKMTEP